MKWLPFLLLLAARQEPAKPNIVFIAARQEPAKPNIVFILADDLGWTDVACYGSRYYETPNLDRLAREGMRFTGAYTNGPNCAPTRAALMSGKYGPRTGIYTVQTGSRGKEEFRKLVPVENRTDLAPEEVTLPEALKAAGYATGAFGKWHLGKDPTQHGFDVHADHGREPFPGTAFITKQGIQFIEKHRDRPFFLYLPYHAVHAPIRAHDAQLVKKYAAKAPAGGHKNPEYAAMLEELDRGIGRVLEKLAELRLADRTVVLFSSDNGGVGGYADAGIKGGGQNTHNAPLRGGKGMLYEGGTRVPLIVRWPGVVKPESVCPETVVTIDFYPTLLDVTGSPRPAQALDGVSFAPLLRSDARAAREAVYWHFPGYLEAGPSSWRTTPCGAIRAGDFKLIEYFEDGRTELYNVKDDIGEKRNLATEMPEKASELRGKLVAWRKDVKAPMPQAKGK